MKTTTLLLLAGLLIGGITASCKYSEHDKTYTYRNTFAQDVWSIDYPSWLRKSKYVYPGSEFQVSNGYRDTYAFMRELVGIGNLDILTDTAVAKLSVSLEDPKIESDSSYNINGAVFRTIELTGRLNDERMYYLISLIESEESQFQFTGWMFNRKRELWEQDYWDMLHSWRRL